MPLDTTKKFPSGNHDIKGVAGGLGSALSRNVNVDRTRPYAETDLSRIGSAGAGKGIGTAGSLGGLAHQFGKNDGTRFKSRCVYVCDVVTDYIHLGLVCLKT